MRARLPLLLSMAALLLLTIVAARGASVVPHGPALLGGLVRRQAQTPPGQSRPVLTGPMRPIAATAAGVVVAVVLVSVVGGALIVAAGIASVRWRGRRRGPRVSTMVDAGDEGIDVGGALALARGARAASARLRARVGGPPADAVQAAWLALEDAAAECGTVRRPEQTSTEFAAALLAAHAVDPAATATLRGLYQRARFDVRATLTGADADSACAALDRIAADLDAEVADRPGARAGSGPHDLAGPR